jgi:F0F1-type ATP synthase assembly protein I
MSALTKSAHSSSCRWAHRKTCILAGGLALIGATFAIVVHPWFAALSAIGGGWLILAPESHSCE